jgi:hypothetical protein
VDGASPTTSLAGVEPTQGGARVKSHASTEDCSTVFRLGSEAKKKKWRRTNGMLSSLFGLLLHAANDVVEAYRPLVTSPDRWHDVQTSPQDWQVQHPLALFRHPNGETIRRRSSRLHDFNQYSAYGTC